MKPIEIKSVSKKYGATTAVDDISFSVNKGEIFGLIGPDGAGKTTLMRMIVSLINADSGSISFMGKSVGENTDFVRAQIGYMPQRFSLYQDLSVEENLRFFADLFGIDANTQKERMQEMYTFSKLGPFKDRNAGNLSGGMKQKLALSCMLMHNPEVMVLDEPTFGVDPISRKEFWDILYELRDKGATLIVSTPYMDEAQRCNRIGLIYDGHLLQCETPDYILKNFPFDLFHIKSDEPHILFNTLKGAVEEQDLQLFPNGIYMVDRHKKGYKELNETVRPFLQHVQKLEKEEAGLENIFLSMMQEKATVE